MLGLVAPHDHGEERRLLLPPTRHCHPEHGPAIPPSVCRSSGWSVRLPAKLTLASVMVLPFLLPGRAVCPALGTGGRWTPRHAARPPGASDGANEVGHRSTTPTMGRLRSRVGWRRLRLGSGMPAPSGQIPPPWAWRENEAPTTRAARGLDQLPNLSPSVLSGWSDRYLLRERQEPASRSRISSALLSQVKVGGSIQG
jgi:hypothetical protein